MKRSSESGSHIIALGLAVVVLAVVISAGYRVWQLQQDTAAPAAANTSAATTAPVKITNTATLNQASAALDSDASQLNSNLNDAAFNADLNSML